MHLILKIKHTICNIKKNNMRKTKAKGESNEEIYEKCIIIIDSSTIV